MRKQTKFHTGKILQGAPESVPATVMIDARTIIQLKAGEDPEEARARYLANREAAKKPLHSREQRCLRYAVRHY